MPAASAGRPRLSMSFRTRPRGLGGVAEEASVDEVTSGEKGAGDSSVDEVTGRPWRASVPWTWPRPRRTAVGGCRGRRGRAGRPWGCFCGRGYGGGWEERAPPLQTGGQPSGGGCNGQPLRHEVCNGMAAGRSLRAKMHPSADNRVSTPFCMCRVLLSDYVRAGTKVREPVISATFRENRCLLPNVELF